jgi:predicted transcriptional regulator
MYSPKNLKPAHLHMIRLFWQGETKTDIALLMHVTPQTVGNVVDSAQGQAILEALQNETIDTMSLVQADAQHCAPLVYDQLFKLAMSSGDDRVRKSACVDILAIAGHVPIRRIAVEKATADPSEYDGKTVEELRSMIFDDLTSNPPKAPDGSTIQ